MAQLWSIIHASSSRLEIFSPTFPCICPSHLLSVRLHLFTYIWLIVSSATAHAWHHIHFLRRLTGGGDATRQDQTGPWALELNGANHLRTHRQIPAPLMSEWVVLFFFFGLHWMPGGKARRHGSMLGFEPVSQGRSKRILREKERKPGLIPSGWRPGLRPGSI